MISQLYSNLYLSFSLPETSFSSLLSIQRFILSHFSGISARVCKQSNTSGRTLRTWWTGCHTFERSKKRREEIWWTSGTRSRIHPDSIKWWAFLTICKHTARSRSLKDVTLVRNLWFHNVTSFMENHLYINLLRARINYLSTTKNYVKFLYDSFYQSFLLKSYYDIKATN